MFGGRQEEERRLRVVTGLDQRLEAISHPEDLAVALVASLKDALAFSYVSVSIADDGIEPLYVSGSRPADVVDVEVRHGGSRVGVVHIGDERGPIDAARRATAEAAIAHAGTAIAALRLRQALEAEQQQLDGAREEERRRLSRDLHDRVGPALAGLKIGLSTHRGEKAGDGVPLDALAGHAREVVREVRGVLAAEAPVAIEDKGLGGAVEDLAGRLAADGRLSIAVRSSDDLGALPPEVAETAYAIVAEALHNVVRHADARSCTVAIVRSGAQLRLVVEDDGRGNARGPQDAPGVGLRSMRKSSATRGGTVDVQPRDDGRGTRVLVELDAGPR